MFFEWVFDSYIVESRLSWREELLVVGPSRRHVEPSAADPPLEEVIAYLELDDCIEGHADFTEKVFQLE